MSNQFRDFDSFFEEMDANKKPIIVKLYGKEYHIDPDIPATTFLDMHRALKDGNKTVSEDKQITLAVNMVGEANVTEWCEKGLSLTKLRAIMDWVSEQIMDSEENKEDNTNKKK